MSGASLTVELGERSYPIRIGRGLAPAIAAEAAAGHRIAVITDANVARRQAAFLEAAFGGAPVLALPPGEETKCFAQLERCCEFLARSGIDRAGRVFAVGGGVIGDLAGFAAACHLRGVGFVQVPTTLLAMVDSSVGGKTGVNLACGKNLAGAFHQPLAVYADLDTLRTLPGREFAAGMAEVIKHGLLADAGLFHELEQGPRLDAASPGLAAVVRRNCAIKAAVVAADEREQAASGGRALLNLGHTFGHAIEAVAGYGEYLHGEAVAIGLVLAARLSERLGRVGADVPARVAALLETYGLPVRLRAPLPLADLLAAAGRDKKARAGTATFVVLEAVGRAVTVRGIDPELIAGLWREAGAA